jgi:glycosyltransferase involved in cell wall biosynthesis
VRILHVTAGNLFGGIERMLLGIAAAASDECAHDIALSFEGRLARELRAAGERPHVLGDVRFRRPHAVWRARRALRGAIADAPCDAVIAHAPWSCALATPVARRARLPLLLWVHDAPNPDEWPERRVSRVPPDRFICNSRYTASLAAAWMPAVPVDVIHPPVAAAPRLSPIERHALRAHLGAADATTVVLIAARLEEWKGHRVLIEAARQLRGNVAIWIAGGPQRVSEVEYLRQLKDLAADPSSAARVHFLGERTDVPRLMGAADVYCQPNTAPEPFGVVFVEALAAGLPVVTTAMGGPLEILDDACAIRLKQAAAPLVARALQRLHDNRPLRAALGAQGPAQAFRISDPSARVRQICDAVRAQRIGTSAA